VGPREALQSTRVRLEGARLHRPSETVDAVKLRYRSAPIPCRVVDDGGRLELVLERPATAVAPGQLACLLHADCVVGEGTIA
jgi:tRNA-specific 2-thiouridylase